MFLENQPNITMDQKRKITGFRWKETWMAEWCATKPNTLLCVSLLKSPWWKRVIG